MERIAIDILGELPKNYKSDKYIVVITDLYTKWTESFLMDSRKYIGDRSGKSLWSTNDYTFGIGQSVRG